MNRQRGLGLISTLILLILAIFVAIMAMKAVPSYIEFASIQKALSSMAVNGELNKGTVKEVRDAFDRRAAIDNITSIKGEDLDVTKEGGQTVVQASYTTKIPLVANISLLIEFNASSAK